MILAFFLCIILFCCIDCTIEVSDYYNFMQFSLSQEKFYMHNFYAIINYLCAVLKSYIYAAAA